MKRYIKDNILSHNSLLPPSMVKIDLKAFSYFLTLKEMAKWVCIVAQNIAISVVIFELSM